MAKKKEFKQYYTVDERIRRVWDIEEIKDLMCRRSFYYANNDRRGELNNCWVAEPKHRKSASFGSNWGYYVGMDEISNWYVVQHDEKMKAALKAINAEKPEIAYTEANQGRGCYFYQPMSTPMVVLSGDGETAKGMWYSIGNDSVYSGGEEAECRWKNGRVAADFVKENGEWKIWHLHMYTDFMCQFGDTFTGSSSGGGSGEPSGSGEQGGQIAYVGEEGAQELALSALEKGDYLYLTQYTEFSTSRLRQEMEVVPIPMPYDTWDFDVPNYGPAAEQLARYGLDVNDWYAVYG